MEADSVKFLGTFVSEQFYFIMSVLMLLIHAGFLAYEGGAARTKNVLATMVKNLLTLASVGISFYLFGWWVYNAFPFWPVGGPILGPWTNSAALPDTIKTAFETYTVTSYPWATNLGVHLGDHMTGVFWFAFALFAMTTASILSGALIERVKLGGYLILSVFLGSFVWVVAAAWGWNFYGWLTTKLGYHDYGCSGVVHGVSGFFALGVLIVLGPRIGKFVDGKARPILPHNLPMTMVGLMLIFVGFYGFLGACAIMLPASKGIITIYGTPMTLASLGVNTTLALAGGLIGAYVSSKGDPFFTISGGLVGIIGCSSGIDLYHPSICIVLAFVVAYIMPKVAALVEKAGIDDAVGAFAVHGFGGLFGVLAFGIFGGGYVQGEGYPATNFMAQAIGALIMCVGLGFIPGYGLAFVLNKFGMLRESREAELRGLDLSELGIDAYPETFGSSITVKEPVEPEVSRPVLSPAATLASEGAA
jgi:ammonia channel protein AmtB